MAKIKSCGFLIYRNQPQKSFLLMRHVDRWDLPKGHVDAGESNFECALRELEEETGIRASDIRVDAGFKFKHKYRVNGKQYSKIEKKSPKKKLIIYLAELICDVKIEPTEHPGYQWFDWQPPHDIQEKTINPLLDALQEFWSTSEVPAAEGPDAPGAIE